MHFVPAKQQALAANQWQAELRAEGDHAVLRLHANQLVRAAWIAFEGIDATLDDADESEALASQYCPGASTAACPYYDYQGKLYGKTGLAYETALSLTGGTDVTKYYLGVNDKSDPGTMLTTGARRQNVRLNVDQSLGSRWTTSASAAIYRSQTTRGISNNDNTFTSPIYAAVQALSGPRLRATGAATFMLIANLVGQGLGPLLTGWLSDQFSQAYGSEGLRYALLAGASTYLLGALAYLMAARTAVADIADANEAWDLPYDLGATDAERADIRAKIDAGQTVPTTYGNPLYAYGAGLTSWATG